MTMESEVVVELRESILELQNACVLLQICVSQAQAGKMQAMGDNLETTVRLVGATLSELKATHTVQRAILEG